MKDITMKQIGILALAAIGVYLIYTKFIKKPKGEIAAGEAVAEGDVQEQEESSVGGGGGGGGIAPSAMSEEPKKDEKKIEMTNLVLPTGGGTNVNVSNNQTVGSSPIPSLNIPPVKKILTPLPEKPPVSKRDEPLSVNLGFKKYTPLPKKPPIKTATTVKALIKSDESVEKAIIQQRPLLRRPIRPVPKRKPILKAATVTTKTITEGK